MDGMICGGKPDSRFIAKVLPGFAMEFLMSDDAFAYLDKKRAFLTQLRAAMPNETAYTMISLFTMKANSMYRVWQPLLGKTGHYTSFTHFLREFEKRRFPDLSQAAYINFRRCRQGNSGNSETVREYWLRFSDYAQLVEVKAETHVVNFINGVAQKRIRDALRVKWSECGKMETLIELADSMEQGDEMEKLRQEEGTRYKAVFALDFFGYITTTLL